MNTVLDTNIFISGIFWQGSSNKIINLWRQEKFNLIVSDGILLELNVEINNKLDVVKEDPKDNIFIESALAGNAEYIVSQDNHLLKIKEFQGIKIVSPEEFLSLF